MRKEIKDQYGPKVGKFYEEDLSRVKRKNYSSESKRLEKVSEKNLRDVQKQAARKFNTKVAKEAAAKAAKAAKLVTRANLATTATAVTAPYITKGINKVVDKGFKYLSKKNSGSQRKEIK